METNQLTRMTAAAVSGLLGVILLAAPAVSESPQRGGALTIAIAGDPENFDPADHVNIGALTIRMVHEGLVRFKPFADRAEVEPALAESWEVSEDGLTWTFNLRRDVTFHDGTPFHSAAVTHYFDRVLNGPPTSKGSPLFRPIVASVDAPDDHTVVIQLNSPQGFFLHRLAHEAAYLNSPTAQQTYGADFIYKPVGTGPFRFVEFVSGERVVLEANRDYWRGAPYLDQVIQLPVREQGTRLLQLEAGQLHVASLLTEEMLPRLESNTALKPVVAQSNRAFRITLNTSRPPFDDVRVRQALNYAIDKDEIAEFLYGGLATVIPGGLSPRTAGYADIAGYGYNPDKARALLAEAGLGDGFSFTLTLHGGGTIMPKDLPLAEHIQQVLSGYGIDMSLQTMEWAVIAREGREPKESNSIDASFEQWPPSTGEASWVFNATAMCGAVPPNGVNRAFYCNPAFDHLVSTSMQQVDPELRDEYLRAAQLVLREDAPWVFLISPSIISGHAASVNDLVIDPVSAGSAWAIETTWIRQ